MLVVLLLLLVVADRAGAAYAGRQIADELASAGGFDSPPDVTVEGVPFLTQAVRGEYRRIEVAASSVETDELTLSELDARLFGARIPLSDVLADAVMRVPADRIQGTALVTYDELESLAAEQDAEIDLSAEGDQLRVAGEVVLLGQEFSASALSNLSVEEGEIVLRAESFDVGNEEINELLNEGLRGELDQRFDLGGLPYGLVLDEVEVQEDGLLLSASAEDTVLEVQGS